MSYAKIVRHYDHIFPLQPLTLQFLQESFAAGGRVLDVGCGTGAYAVGLARSGFRVDGLDLDAQMLAVAGQQAEAAGVEVACTLGSMTELPRHYAPATFAGVFCIGNSLAHVAGHAELEAVCGDLRTLLQPGGTLVLQVINYERIIRQQLSGLPTLENCAHNLQFERHYQIDFPNIRFTTVLRVDGESEVSEISLYALMPDELVLALQKAGFHDVATYGSFAEAPFERETAQPLIVRTRA